MEKNIAKIQISKLKPFEDTPFKLRYGEKMDEITESITKVGLLVPIIVRPYSDSQYEILSGHMRVKIFESIGIDTISAIVKDVDDDEAAIIVVDSNIHRDYILPSEKAFAYKMRLDAMKRKAGRPSKNNSDQIGLNYDGKQSSEILAEIVGESKNQIQRYIRLTNLIDPILDMVDNGDLAINAAVELSYLGSKHQSDVYYAMGSEDTSPSIEQAKLMRRLGSKDELNQNMAISILREQPDFSSKIAISGNKIRKYFPKNYTIKQMLDKIIELPEEWNTKSDKEL